MAPIQLTFTIIVYHIISICQLTLERTIFSWKTHALAAKLISVPLGAKKEMKLLVIPLKSYLKPLDYIKGVPTKYPVF